MPATLRCVFRKEDIPILDAFPTFVAVADAGSFSAVARARDVAVSSITRRIEALEAELGTKLFIRGSRRLQLTDAGSHLLPRARGILAEVRDAREDLASLEDDVRGVLSVTAPTMFGRRHVAPAVCDFLRRHPRIEVELHFGDEVVDLGERRVDVAIRIGPVTDGDLVTTRLAPSRRAVCASPAYLERAGRPASPADLLDHNCLSTASPRLPSGWWSFEEVNRNQPLPVRGNLRSDDTGALLQAAEAGVGIVHLATWLVGDLVASGGLVVLFPTLGPPAGIPSSIRAVRMPGRSHTAKSRLFVAHLKAWFGSPPYWESTMPEPPDAR